MSGTLDDLLAATDPQGGICPDWKAWDQDVRPQLADYLELLGDPRADFVRRLRLVHRDFEIDSVHQPAWLGHYHGERPCYLAQDVAWLPESWEVYRVRAATQMGWWEHSASGFVAVGRGTAWPPEGGIVRFLSYAAGFPRTSNFVESVSGPLLVGLHDRSSPPTNVIVAFEHAGRPYEASFVLTIPGVMERATLLRQFALEPP